MKPYVVEVGLEESGSVFLLTDLRLCVSTVEVWDFVEVVSRTHYENYVFYEDLAFTLFLIDEAWKDLEESRVGTIFLKRDLVIFLLFVCLDEGN